MMMTFEGSWDAMAEVSLAEKHTGDNTENSIFNNAHNSKRMIEITHTDGSIKIFTSIFFNNSISRLFVEDSNSRLVSYSYMNGRSEDFGTLTTVRIYPREIRITAVLEAIKSSLYANIQSIVIEFLER